MISSNIYVTALPSQLLITVIPKSTSFVFSHFSNTFHFSLVRSCDGKPKPKMREEKKKPKNELTSWDECSIEL